MKSVYTVYLTPERVSLFEKVEQYAACRGRTDMTPQITHPDVVLEQLLVCDGCKVKASCFDVVEPRKSIFDGVCAGVAWRDGLPYHQGYAPRGLGEGTMLARKIRERLTDEV